MAQPVYIGLWSPNSWLHLDLPPLLAGDGVGVVPLPVESPASLLRHYVQVAGLQALICDGPRAALARQWMPEVPVIELEQLPSAVHCQLKIQQLLGTPRGLVSCAPPRLLFSSGTTGLPRAVVRPVEADQFRMTQFKEFFGLHSGMRHIVAGPLYHSGPAIFALTHRGLGCSLHVLEQFDAQQVLQLLASERTRIFTLFLVPTQLRKLESERAACGLPWSTYASLARMWIAGSRFDRDLKLLFAQQLAPNTLWEFYGATETGTIAVQSQQHMIVKPDSVGRPAAGVRVDVRDAHGRLLPAGQVGRLWVRSPMNASTVHGGPDLEHDRSGALCLGDCGWLDDDGDLHLTGREADMFISGGVNVYPAQVEDAMRSLPQVADALAFSVQDALWGDRIEAMAVPRGNPPPGLIVEDQLRSLLPPAARPKQIHWVSHLPLTGSGKPDRGAARKLAKNLI